jgi:23S rRNA U2552 (ribose-2'-O)-methylase RlmE/FtsJ
MARIFYNSKSKKEAVEKMSAYKLSQARKKYLLIFSLTLNVLLFGILLWQHLPHQN